LLSFPENYRPGRELKVIAYYSGGADKVSNYEVEKLTHIIYCFSHLKGNQLTID